jgi:hypothetical protein
LDNARVYTVFEYCLSYYTFHRFSKKVFLLKKSMPMFFQRKFTFKLFPLKNILHEAKKREISFPILFVKQFDDPLFCVQNGAIKIRALNLPLGLTATQLCAHVKSNIKSASTNLYQGSKMIIFESILNNFAASLIFRGSSDSRKNWLRLKIKPP